MLELDDKTAEKIFNIFHEIKIALKEWNDLLKVDIKSKDLKELTELNNITSNLTKNITNLRNTRTAILTPLIVNHGLTEVIMYIKNLGLDLNFSTDESSTYNMSAIFYIERKLK